MWKNIGLRSFPNWVSKQVLIEWPYKREGEKKIYIYINKAKDKRSFYLQPSSEGWNNHFYVQTPSLCSNYSPVTSDFRIVKNGIYKPFATTKLHI